MKSIASMAACALCLAGLVQAAEQPMQSGTAHGPVMASGRADGVHQRTNAPLPNLAITRRDEIITPLTHLPQLPEPEVFAMMLVGLVLIGYRVSRDGGDKFR
jgi:hypothetical protein